MHRLCIQALCLSVMRRFCRCFKTSFCLTGKWKATAYKTEMSYIRTAWCRRQMGQISVLLPLSAPSCWSARIVFPMAEALTIVWTRRLAGMMPTWRQEPTADGWRHLCRPKCKKSCLLYTKAHAMKAIGSAAVMHTKNIPSTAPTAVS